MWRLCMMMLCVVPLKNRPSVNFKVIDCRRLLTTDWLVVQFFPPKLSMFWKIIILCVACRSPIFQPTAALPASVQLHSACKWFSHKNKSSLDISLALLWIRQMCTCMGIRINSRASESDGGSFAKNLSVESDNRIIVYVHVRPVRNWFACKWNLITNE